MKKLLSLLFIFVLLFSSSYGFSENSKKKNNSNSKSPKKKEFYLDTDININDTENELLNRVDDAILNGDYDKALDDSKLLLTRFVGEDKQNSIVNLSFLLVEILIRQSNYSTAFQILKDTSYRINNYVVADQNIIKAWQIRLKVYLYWLEAYDIFEKNGDLNPVLAKLNTLRASVLEINSPYSLMLIDNCIGVLLSFSARSLDALDYLYNSLRLANTLHNVWFYYKNSATIIDIYIKNKDFLKAINRLDMLNNLFRNVKISDYYKIKTLILYSKILKAQGNLPKAKAILHRALEAANFNESLADKAALELTTRIKALLEQSGETKNADEVPLGDLSTPTAPSTKKGKGKNNKVNPTAINENDNNSYFLNYIKSES